MHRYSCQRDPAQQVYCIGGAVELQVDREGGHGGVGQHRTAGTVRTTRYRAQCVGSVAVLQLSRLVAHLHRVLEHKHAGPVAANIRGLAEVAGGHHEHGRAGGHYCRAKSDLDERIIVWIQISGGSRLRAQQHSGCHSRREPDQADGRVVPEGGGGRVQHGGVQVRRGCRVGGRSFDVRCVCGHLQGIHSPLDVQCRGVHILLHNIQKLYSDIVEAEAMHIRPARVVALR